MLTVNELRKRFNRGRRAVDVFDGLSFQVGDECVAICGPSGCGKTTLLRIVAGLERPSSGTVNLGKSRMGGSQSDIGFVFQNSNLLPWRSARRNVELPLELRRGNFRPSRVERARLATELLRSVGLDENAMESYPAWLSGGMAQRVAVARAIVADPDLLLLDEPFSALDGSNQETMQTLLTRLWEPRRIPMILVTHHPDEAVFLADRVLVLSAGPARVVHEYVVSFDRPRLSELRHEPRFREAVEKVRDLIASVGANSSPAVIPHDNRRIVPV